MRRQGNHLYRVQHDDDLPLEVRERELTGTIAAVRAYLDEIEAGPVGPATAMIFIAMLPSKGGVARVGVGDGELLVGLLGKALNETVNMYIEAVADGGTTQSSTPD